MRGRWGEAYSGRAEQTEDEAERGCILAKGVYCIPFPIELETCGRGLEARNKSSLTLNLRSDPKKEQSLSETRDHMGWRTYILQYTVLAALLMFLGTAAVYNFVSYDW